MKRQFQNESYEQMKKNRNAEHANLLEPFKNNSKFLDHLYLWNARVSKTPMPLIEGELRQTSSREQPTQGKLPAEVKNDPLKQWKEDLIKSRFGR